MEENQAPDNKELINGSEVISLIEKENTLVLENGTLTWDDLDIILDKLEEGNLVNTIKIDNVNFRTRDDLKDILELCYDAGRGDEGQKISRVELRHINFEENLKSISALVTLIFSSKADPIDVSITHSTLGLSALGFVLGMLRRAKNLKNLDLSHNDIQEESANVIARALKKRGAPIEINLEGNEIDEKGLKKIRDVIEDLKNTEKIEMSQRSASGSGAKTSRFDKKSTSAGGSSRRSTRTDGSKDRNKKEMVKYSVASQSQLPRIMMECQTGRVLPLKDFYVSLKTSRVYSIFSLKKEINYTFCKISGETSTVKAVRNASKHVSR